MTRKQFGIALPWALGLFPALALTIAVSGAEPAGEAKIDFIRDIQPILQKNCLECHGPEKQKGRIRFDSRQSVFEGGETGKAITVGRGDESLIIHRVLGLDGNDRMPLKHDALSAGQIALLKEWVNQGADWPASASVANATVAKHWAYVKPVRPPLPAVQNKEWIRNPIDAFVLAHLEKEGLKPSPPAAAEVLCRRLYLDLIGLPPTPSQVDDFVHDPSSDAYEKLVDRLLASPRYGERWARPWLDLARYADTNGYEKDNRRSIWKWRDWVIQSLNSDMSFKEFTIEQIAGDLLPNATIEQKIATGFHRNTMVNEEGGVDPQEDRWKRQVDRVFTTSEVWLGSTMQCAQCHNHKYDPITSKDFYSMLAFWENSDEPTLNVPDAAPEGKRKQSEQELARLEEILKEPTAQLAAEQAQWEKGLGAGIANEWTAIDPDTFTAASGAVLTKRSDGSIIAAGPAPERDAYTIVAKTNLTSITGFRLEALADPSLPGHGPGNSESGNFVLSEFKVSAGKAAATARPIRMRRAAADFSQEGWPVAAALDGRSSTGWGISPQLGKDHVAIFETAGAVVGIAGGTTLTFTLEQAGYPRHTLGRFKLSVTHSPRPADALALPPAVRDVLAIATSDRTAAQKEELAAYFRTIAPSLAATRQQIDHLKAVSAKVPSVTTMVLQERAGGTRPTTDMRVRGSYLQHGEPVLANTPAVLHPFPADAPYNRLGLARWLASEENPLVARVTVNRYWETLFGRGLVETTDDFGTQGSRPSHPELLDWLACEFMTPTAPGSAAGWSMKRIKRTIVLSATYRQSSAVTAGLLEKDPYNILLARGPRFRLEAEAVRDNSLAIAGLLSEKMYGPSVMPYQPEGVWDVPYSGDRWVESLAEDRYRRGVYTFWRRSAPYPTFISFDAPSREGCTIRRVRTDTPMQALSVMNDPAFVEAAKALASRMVGESGDSSIPARATLGFRLCAARTPNAAELAQLVTLYNHSLDDYRKDAPAAAAMAKGVNTPAAMDPAEAAAWAVVANVLMNLDETVTKG